VAGEKARVATSERIIIAAQRVSVAAAHAASRSSSTAAAALDVSGTAFVIDAGSLFTAAAAHESDFDIVSGSVTSEKGVDRMQATYMYDAHSADEVDAAARAAATTPPTARGLYAGSQKASGTVSLSFQFPSDNGTDLRLPVHNLTVPAFFTVPLTSGLFTTGRPACPDADATNTTTLNKGRAGEIQPTCTFWDETKRVYSDEGCGTLPPVGLYTLNAVDPELESGWFQPLSLSGDILGTSITLVTNITCAATPWCTPWGARCSGTTGWPPARSTSRWGGCIRSTQLTRP
jgi:hypothetical protein